MGLQDRDYMHRRERPFTPPDGGPSILFILLLVVASVFVLFKGYEWLLERQANQRQKAMAPKAALNPQLPIVAPQPKQLEQASAWTRCEVAGRVVYSDTGCPDVRQGSSAPSSLNFQVPRAPTQAALAVTTLYHCKAYAGGTFWANSHCNQHKALVDRMVGVPSTLPFDQQVALAENNRSAATALASNTVAGFSSPTVASTKKAECKALDEQVARWDAMARQPQSAQTQDWIRGQRKKARDRQFALRC